MPYAVELYDNEDHWVCTAVALPSRIQPEDDYGSYTYTTRLNLPRALTRKQRRQACYAAMSTLQWHCHCEHDCCGCTFAWSSAIIVNARTLSVTTHVSRNI
jgi:hypothetical protein